jgi:hypothetical protein
MPRIIIQVSRPPSEHGRVTFSERVTAANLDSEHYTQHLIERIAWAIADAEEIETSPLSAKRDRAFSTPARTRQAGAPGRARAAARD